MIHSKGNVYSDSSQIQGKSKFVIIMFLSYFNIEPAQDILVRIVSAMSEWSGEPALPRSLARSFAYRTRKWLNEMKGQTKDWTYVPTR